MKMKQVGRCWLMMAVVLFVAAPTLAQVAFGPDPDPNQSTIDPGDPLLFDTSDIFSFGIYGFDDTAVEANGNDMAVYSVAGPGTFNDGAGWTVRISNGENGNNGDDPMNPDPMNTEPANPIFGFNGSNRLENGNVVRLSMWMRQDPAAPVLVPPQIEPIIKLEFWTEALSGDADFSLSPNPGFGDRIFDTDQNGAFAPGAPLAEYIDINGDGVSNGNPLLTPPNFSIQPQDDWTLVHTMWEVDDTGWGYANIDGNFVAKTVTDVEEVRAVMFVGDFAGTDFGEDPNAFWIDNPMVEIYQNAGAVPVEIPNPFPAAVNNCDFDGSGVCDIADVDMLTMAIAAMSMDLTFDLNDDMMVDAADIAEWLIQAGADPANAGDTGGNPYLAGDFDLNGFVDGQDFDVWNSSKFTATGKWSLGDANGDGFSDGRDFIVWNGNKFMSSADGVAAVPEPGSLVLLGMALAFFGVRRRS